VESQSSHAGSVNAGQSQCKGSHRLLLNKVLNITSAATEAAKRESEWVHQFRHPTCCAAATRQQRCVGSALHIMATIGTRKVYMTNCHFFILNCAFGRASISGSNRNHPSVGVTPTTVRGCTVASMHIMSHSDTHVLGATHSTTKTLLVANHTLQQSPRTVSAPASHTARAEATGRQQSLFCTCSCEGRDAGRGNRHLSHTLTLHSEYRAQG
jgi:hypothetical protein